MLDAIYVTEWSTCPMIPAYVRSKAVRLLQVDARIEPPISTVAFCEHLDVLESGCHRQLCRLVMHEILFGYCSSVQTRKVQLTTFAPFLVAWRLLVDLSNDAQQPLQGWMDEFCG